MWNVELRANPEILIYVCFFWFLSAQIRVLDTTKRWTKTSTKKVEQPDKCQQKTTKMLQPQKSIPSVFLYGLKRFNAIVLARDTDRAGYQQAFAWPKKETSEGPKTM